MPPILGQRSHLIDLRAADPRPAGWEAVTALLGMTVERLASIAAPLVHVGDFTGRADRRTFAGALVFVGLVMAAGRAMDWLIFGASPGALPAYFVAIFIVALTPPLLAISVRRLNDTGRSGWLLLLAMLPVVGWLALGWCLTRRSVSG
jgi:uncharacterized membrane protein YhaH (DUF805 family)